MSSKLLPKTHRSWEDLAVAFLGIGLMAVTWSHSTELARGMEVPGYLINAGVIGVLLLILGFYEIASWSRFIEYAVGAMGLWLIASPFVLGFAANGNFATWHYAIGLAVTVLAALELWQDWDLSDDQMARHGH